MCTAYGLTPDHPTRMRFLQYRIPKLTVTGGDGDAPLGAAGSERAGAGGEGEQRGGEERRERGAEWARASCGNSAVTLIHAPHGSGQSGWIRAGAWAFFLRGGQDFCRGREASAWT